MMGLTKRQKDCLDYIDARWQETGIPPSYREIASHLGLASVSGVHRLITALEERGCIERIPDRARALRPSNREAVISIMLPPDLEDRLRTIASHSNLTPEGFVVKIVKDRLLLTSERARR